MESHLRKNLFVSSAVPKILFPTPNGFTQTAESPTCLERPMTLNAWTQTTIEDAEYLRAEYHHHHELNGIYQETENERKLQEKIRSLEKTLQVQAELLSQIHATSAGGRNSLQLQQQNNHHHHYPQQQQQEHISGHSQTNITSPNSTSLINQFQQEPKETIKYTIIAEGANGDDNDDEPIEIHLAEDDGAINLNSSADSGRLEIYIDSDQQQQQLQKQRQQQQQPLQIGIVKCETLKSEEINGETSPGRAVMPPSSPTIPARTLTTSQANDQVPPGIATITTTTKPSSVSATMQLSKRRKIEQSSPCADVHRNDTVNSNQIIQDEAFSLNHSKRSSNKIESQTTLSTHSTGYAISSNKRRSTLKMNNNILRSPEQNVPVGKFASEKAMISIGPNNTLIPEEIYACIPWKSASIATRRLLMTIFDRTTLATHSMTGKPSPAFKDQNKPLKKMLDRSKVEDIIYAVTTKCNVTDKEVRNAITTKCADENKMMKLQIGKGQNAGSIDNKENIVV